MPPETFTLSWDVMHRDARALARLVAAKGRFSTIVAVTRGGLVPAAIIATQLDIKRVETLCVASYDGRIQGGIEVIKGLEGDGTDWLVIDDLVDSGVTAQAIRAMLPQAHFATLYAKPKGRPLVDTFVSEIPQHVWVIFPWEV